MTRKDFQLIADVINNMAQHGFLSASESGHPEDEAQAIGGQFADALARTNPAFNRSLFIAACKRGLV